MPMTYLKSSTNKFCNVVFLMVLMLLFPYPVTAYDFDDVIRAHEKDSGRVNPMRMLERYKTVIKEISGMEVPIDIEIIEKSRGDAREEFFESYLKDHENLVEIETEIDGYEYFLKRLKLFEEDQSLKAYYRMNVYNNVLGLYMWDKKKLVLMKGSSQLVASMTLLHELTHAAQSSVVDLDKLNKLRQKNTDSLLALSSITEGQATVVELLLRLKKNIGDKSIEKTLKELTLNYKKILKEDNFGSIMEATQLFPYTYGYIFVANQYMASKSKDFQSMFRRLPISTEQVLHYNKYLKNEKPKTTVLEQKEKTLNTSWKKLYSTTLGEYYIGAIYNFSLEKNKKLNMKAAAGWGGDRLCIFEISGNKFFVWDTLWDRAIDAKEFLTRYTKFIQTRTGKKMLLNKSGFNAVYPKENPEYFIKRTGKRVIIIEGKVTEDMLKKISSKLKI